MKVNLPLRTVNQGNAKEEMPASDKKSSEACHETSKLLSHRVFDDFGKDVYHVAGGCWVIHIP